MAAAVEAAETLLARKEEDGRGQGRGLDVLINCAGVNGVYGGMAEEMYVTLEGEG